MNLEKQLARFAQECVRLNADRWRLSLRNGFDFHVSATRDDGFLSLIAETELEAKPERLLHLAERSAELPCNLKLSLSPWSREIHLRADFPLPEEGDDTCRVGLYLNAMQCAHEQVHNWTSCEAGETVGLYSGDRPPDLTGLEKILDEAGWETHRRAGGALLADLEAPGQFFQAEVKRLAEGARFRAAVYNGPNLSDDAQRSLPAFLLEINAALRYSRTFLERSQSGVAAGFEIRMDWMPVQADASGALAALSVACRRCARELDLLSRDASLARLYWAARGLPFSKKEQAHG